jgi:hypothetical protein
MPATQIGALGSLRRTPRNVGRREQEHRDRDYASPHAARGAGGRRRDRLRVDDEIAQGIDPLAFIPCGARVEFDAKRRSQHRGGQVFDIFAGFRLRHAETMVLGNIAIVRGVSRPREPNSGIDPASGLVGLGARHHAERYLARTQRFDAGAAGNKFALRRQNRGYRNKILLLDIGVAQRVLERRKLLAMDADAAGQEYALGNWKHRSSTGPEIHRFARCRWHLPGYWAAPAPDKQPPTYPIRMTNVRPFPGSR